MPPPIVGSFSRTELESRKADLERSAIELQNEYQRMLGAIQVVDALINELKERETENDR
jgi:hypothetical protein